MEKQGSPQRVLLVEDDEPNRYAMRHLLRAAGVADIREAASADEAITKLNESPQPECVLLDWLIPGEGSRVLSYVREKQLPVGVIVVTVAYERYHREISKLRPDGIFRKPFEPDEVVTALRAAARNT